MWTELSLRDVVSFLLLKRKTWRNFMLVSSGVIITSISLENDSVCFESHSLRIQILQINFLHNERERRKDGRRGDRCCPTTIKSLKSYSNFQRIHMQSLLSLSLSLVLAKTKETIVIWAEKQENHGYVIILIIVSITRIIARRERFFGETFSVREDWTDFV